MQHSSESFWMAVTRAVPIFPVEEQQQKVIEIHRNLFAGTVPAAIAAVAFLVTQRQFIAAHYRLARAVQPTGKILDPLAATIGAIVLEDKTHYESATAHLADKVIEALKCGDKSTLQRIQKLFKPRNQMHRNFQIWVAIAEFLDTVAKDATANVSPSEHLDTGSLGSAPQYPRMPSTADIKDYVTERCSDPRFFSLKTLDNKGWARLWEDSGVDSKSRVTVQSGHDSILPKGRRGKGKNKY
ncbi:MAG: hypothetical protein WCK77_14530 [Verrucomicrobiota bacterium]